MTVKTRGTGNNRISFVIRKVEKHHYRLSVGQDSSRRTSSEIRIKRHLSALFDIENADETKDTLDSPVDSDQSPSTGNNNNNMKTTIGRKWSGGPMWIHQRSLGKNKPQRLQASHDLIRRLGLEASFSMDKMAYTHFPMDWNQKGTLLAIAQNDPYLVSVWDVFKQREVCKVDTGYTWCVYHVPSVKFVPNNDAQIIVCRPKGGLRLIDIVRNENSPVSGRKRINDIAIHSSEPNLIWSAGEDGYIACCDIRQDRECASYQYQYKLPRRIVINPLHSQMFAVGYSYGYVRLFDRRALRSGASPSCIAHFVPASRAEWRSFGLVGLAFNSGGSELLASIQGEQVYLFNTYEPWEKYRSFDLSIKPLLSDEPELTSPCTSSKLKSYSYLKELRKQCPVEMHDELKALCDDILSRDSAFKGPSNIVDYVNKSLEKELLRESDPNQRASSMQDENIINYLNLLLDKVKNCPDLYRARARAFRRRARMGDLHQSLRDCCCALALKPLDFETIYCLSKTLIKMKKDKDICRLLQFVDDAIKEFGDQDDLTKSREMLLAFKEGGRDEVQEALPDFESTYTYGREVNDGSSMRILDYNRRYRSTEEEFYCYGVNFFGSNDEFIIGGGEAAFHVWDKSTTNIVKTVDGRDLSIVLPHPSICMVATSGYGETVKLWSPIGKKPHDVDD